MLLIISSAIFLPVRFFPRAESPDKICSDHYDVDDSANQKKVNGEILFLIFFLKNWNRLFCLKANVVTC